MMLFMPLISCEDAGVSACKQCYVAMSTLESDSTEAVYGYRSAAQAEADFRDIYLQLDYKQRVEIRKFVNRRKASARRREVFHDEGVRELNIILKEEE